MLFPHYSPYNFSEDTVDDDSCSDSSISGKSSDDEDLPSKKEVRKPSVPRKQALQNSSNVKYDNFSAKRSKVEEKARQTVESTEKIIQAKEVKDVAEFDYDMSSYHPPF